MIGFNAERECGTGRAAKTLHLPTETRDFEKTPEPSGKTRRWRRSTQRRFVIQKHAATRLHYDFRLELDGVFKIAGR